MRNYIYMPKKPRTLAQMRAYLKGHFRYGEYMQPLGIACRVKIHDLSTTSKEREAMYSALSDHNPLVYEVSGVNGELKAFSAKRDKHIIYQLGRSGGYFCLFRASNKIPMWGGPETLDPAEIDEMDSPDIRYCFGLVWDFDKACNAAVDAFVKFSVSEYGA